MPIDSISMCSNTLYMSNMDVQVIQNPQKSWANLGGYKCMRLLLCAYGQHINVLKYFVYAQYGCGKQFEVAVSLNHDVMT
jgi:hypothetical protein